MILALGIDPGRHTGVALVSAVRGELPRLVRLWRVVGVDGPDRHREFYDRWQRVADSVHVAIGGRDLAAAWIEEPPHMMRGRRRRDGEVNRGRGLPGDTQGIASWLGLGRYQGLGMAACYGIGVSPRPVEVGVWVKTWRGQILPSKRDGGGHRVDEAGRLVPGAAEALAGIPATVGRVDCAEAVLVAGAAALWALGEASAVGRVPVAGALAVTP